MERLGELYEIDQLVSKYSFSGRTPMDVPHAIEIRAELEKIDELIRQLEEARESAQIAVIDLEALSEYADPGEIDQLEAIQQQVQEIEV